MSVTLENLRQLDADARTTHHRRRDARERLLHLAEHLPERDRWLVEQVYARGVPISALARAAAGDRPERLAHHRRRLARRLAGIVRRLRDPLFQLVATEPELLPRHTRAPARHVFLHGRSLRETAERTGLTLHHVRRRIQTVRELAPILRNALTTPRQPR